MILNRLGVKAILLISFAKCSDEKTATGTSWQSNPNGQDQNSDPPNPSIHNSPDENFNLRVHEISNSLANSLKSFGRSEEESKKFSILNLYILHISSLSLLIQFNNSLLLLLLLLESFSM